MIVLVLCLVVIDVLYFLWIMGNMPMRFNYPDGNAVFLLVFPALIGMGIYFDLNRSFGTFSDSQVPLYLRAEFYFLYLLIYLGVYSVVMIVIRYYEHLPKNQPYFDGISVKRSGIQFPPTVFCYITLVLSIIGVLYFYVEPGRY